MNRAFIAHEDCFDQLTALYWTVFFSHVNVAAAGLVELALLAEQLQDLASGVFALTVILSLDMLSDGQEAPCKKKTEAEERKMSIFGSAGLS